MKIISFLLSISILFVLGSCHSDNPTEVTGDLKIVSLVKDSVAVGDTIFINGEFLGTSSGKRFISFDSNIVVSSEDCILWSNNLISLIVPHSSKSGFIKIIDNSIALDSAAIKISPVPFFEVVEIPAGKFMRGSETSAPDEFPVKEITISKPFLMTKFEISQRIFESVSGINPAMPVNLILPVVNVKWIEAVQFCNNISELQGLKPYYIITGVDVTAIGTSNGWRLPTEAEWEYACRAGSSGDYSGSTIIDEMGWYGDNSGLKLHPSGTKKSNDFGLFDMHGNCWEWCFDFYSETYYKTGTTTDPQGPNSGKERVMRGGSWNDGKNYARSSNRTLPADFDNNIGFRIVRSKN
jgi:formylglycine-generating enzyme required for sulfatase activity